MMPLHPAPLQLWGIRAPDLLKSGSLSGAASCGSS